MFIQTEFVLILLVSIRADWKLYSIKIKKNIMGHPVAPQVSKNKNKNKKNVEQKLTIKILK